MLIDLSPLRRHRNYRLLYAGQLVSSFGNMVTYVALPYQVYQLTSSSLAVGMIGIAQLVPLLATAFIGGALADSTDRRKLLVGSELALAACSLALALNAWLAHPSVTILYLMAAATSALNGFHRPAYDALNPRLVDREEIPAMSALQSLRRNIAAISGPAAGGIFIAAFGLSKTYSIEAATYAVSITTLLLLRAIPKPEQPRSVSLRSVKEGFAYAISRQELLGTYVVDIVAMVFGMPIALFPAVSVAFGGAKALGWLYSAPSAGALVATLLSGRAREIRRHGAAIVAAATSWGIAIVAFGLTRSYGWALAFLALAGAADMVSGLYRSIIWNETIPDRLRGRLASIEMASYMSGPLLGNAESGIAATIGGVPFSIISGGVLCVAGVLACIPILPRFWRYHADRAQAASLAPTAP